MSQQAEWRSRHEGIDIAGELLKHNSRPSAVTANEGTDIAGELRRSCERQSRFPLPARENASVTRGKPQELRAIGNREARGESKGSKRAAECQRRGPAQQVAHTMLMERSSARKSASIARGTPREYGAIRDREARRESKDSKRAAECQRLGRAQQVACTVSMEHRLR